MSELTFLPFLSQRLDRCARTAPLPLPLLADNVSAAANQPLSVIDGGSGLSAFLVGSRIEFITIVQIDVQVRPAVSLSALASRSHSSGRAAGPLLPDDHRRRPRRARLPRPQLHRSVRHQRSCVPSLSLFQPRIR